jgi:hypothetical protein
MVVRFLQIAELNIVQDFTEFLFNQVGVELTKIFSFFDLQQYTLKRFIVSFLSMNLTLFVCAHVMACLWAASEGYMNLPFSKALYFNSIYYIYQTGAVVGYGDIVVDHTPNRTFVLRMLMSIVVEFFAILFVGYTFSCVSSSVMAIKNINYERKKEVRMILN